MTNLGSDDTPVKGENFSLPAGAQIDEDGGDFVVRDTSGEIILRRDETAGNWNFEGGELRNIGSVHTEDLGISDAGTILERGGVISHLSTMQPSVNPDDVSVDTFTTLVDIDAMVGAISTQDIPNGATIRANFFVRPDSVPSGETGTYRLRLGLANDGSFPTGEDVDELDIDVTDSDDGRIILSGWSEITSINVDGVDLIVPSRIEAKVTGGTLTSSSKNWFGVLWRWEVK